MMRLALMVLLFSDVSDCVFNQTIVIDTTKRLLQNTPFYSTEEAKAVHRRMEKAFDDGRYNIYEDFYLLFRYRDPQIIPVWAKTILQEPEHDLFRLWFVNGVAQTQQQRFMALVTSFRTSGNDILREYVAAAYGFLGTADSIASLEKWLSEEENCYVRKTIDASITAIKNGGYTSKIPYLPKYYQETPRKLKFIYNNKVNDDPAYNFNLIDTNVSVVSSDRCIFPHQQYHWRIRHAPKRGFFGSHTREIFHVGIDSGWMLEGLPVHSIGSGRVKQISHNLSWGTMVIVEFADKNENDTLCAIYAHLSPFIDVNIGDTVSGGDKIGQIGNSCTFSNGGYWAHLHFGIERNNFWDAEIAGYSIDTLTYENPVTFIRKRQ